MRRREQRKLVAASGLFDRGYYLASVPATFAARLWPLRHFLRHGNASGAWPHRLFDTGFYLESYPDVAASGTNALVHFLRYGWREGRNPHPVFETAFVRWQLRRRGGTGADRNPLLAYVESGGRDLDPSPFFETARYLRHLGSRASRELAGTTPLEHFLAHAGSLVDFDPSSLFDTRKYLASYPDTPRDAVLYHFLRHGVHDGHVGSWRPDERHAGQLARLVGIEPQLEPVAARLADLRRVRPPFHAQGRYLLHRQLAGRLVTAPYDLVVLVPVLDGSAWHLAAVERAARAVAAVPGSRVLMLATDEWTTGAPPPVAAPAGLTVVDLLELAPTCSEAERVSAVAHLILTLRPPRVVVIGSRIGAQCGRSYARRIAAVTELELVGDAPPHRHEEAEGQCPTSASS